MADVALGIDTGGTFTDGVIFDLENKTVKAKAKVETTRHDLTLAVNRCLDRLLEAYRDSSGGAIDTGKFKMVALSTTLATNAIVEGQGAEVGLIQIGFAAHKGLPTPYSAVVPGGCTIKGRIREELDLDLVEKTVLEMKDQVDAFAVSGYLSVRNPVQEMEVTDLIRKLTGYPVVAAHQLSSDLGMHERTVTAVLNARLMPLITSLMDSVKEGMERFKITAPLMVVRGDGSLISETKAREKPIETILSGPAASIIGALTLTGVREGIVVDMGGTTTDVAVLKNGRPSLNKEGASVGGWLTRVKAAEITTIGLGGDSLIQVSKNAVLTVGPQRVFPLSWIADRYPYLTEELADIRPFDYTMMDTQPTTILTYIKDPLNVKLTETEQQIIDLIKEKPHTLHYISRKLQKEIDLLPWQRLVNVASVHRASLTPSDILHVNGQLDLWDKRAAELGTAMLADRYRQSTETFVESVIEEILYMLAALIIDRLMEEEGAKFSLSAEEGGSYLLRKLVARDKHSLNEQVEWLAKLRCPVVAVGAPVDAYFPELADRIGAKLHLPSFAEVTNAVGTVSGKAVERITVLVKPGEGGGFLVHTPTRREFFMIFEEAIEYACKEGERYVRDQAAASGAANIETIVERQDHYSKLASTGDSDRLENRLFIESVIEISAVGRPWSD
ncbi:MAG TPA: hydantoinase/oxoprolinase family protein [Firmicutes bacterium]|nr:hydantoinase/oxoprolinase family protein [Bacillota bacterium]